MVNPDARREPLRDEMKNTRVHRLRAEPRLLENLRVGQRLVGVGRQRREHPVTGRADTRSRVDEPALLLRAVEAPGRDEIIAVRAVVDPVPHDFELDFWHESTFGYG